MVQIQNTTFVVPSIQRVHIIFFIAVTGVDSSDTDSGIAINHFKRDTTLHRMIKSKNQYLSRNGALFLCLAIIRRNPLQSILRYLIFFCANNFVFPSFSQLLSHISSVCFFWKELLRIIFFEYFNCFFFFLNFVILLNLGSKHKTFGWTYNCFYNNFRRIRTGVYQRLINVMISLVCNFTPVEMEETTKFPRTSNMKT